MQISKRLCEFLIETKFKDIPKETVEFTKQLGLKTVAGMLNGSKRPAGLLVFVQGRKKCPTAHFS
jgi:hypothetical protein